MSVDATVAHFCPPWAFDPKNRDAHPRTGGKWQPIWDPVRGNRPMPDFEELVAKLLGNAGITYIYEPLLVPIHRPYRGQGVPPRRRHRRHLLRNDFYLPNPGVLIEIYSGYSEQSWIKKLRHLERLSAHHGIPFLLLTVQEKDLLETQPELLQTWLGLSPAAA